MFGLKKYNPHHILGSNVTRRMVMACQPIKNAAELSVTANGRPVADESAVDLPL